ncbi:hypothetical protein C4578_02570 [Candidatus Microgenomates bacterium]|jgi:competence protein ComEC|nr:MAG: hypothetical protein C4578_02570 [Candidatus Microgenomates bacterium]
MRFNKISIFVLSLLCLFVWLAAFSLPDNRFHLVVCDVGQGDGVLLKKGFSQALIDGGPDEKVLDCLSENMPFFDRTIEAVFLTHPDNDHLTGLVSVLDKYKVRYFFDSLVPGRSSTYEALLIRLKHLQNTAKQGEELKVTSLFQGKKIRFQDAYLSVLWPEEGFVSAKLGEKELKALTQNRVLGTSKEKLNLNDFSLVILVQYQNRKFLLMGDADSRVQDKILKFNDLKKVDLLKFPHHGSKTGITEEFLKEVNPVEAVISVGKNSFGHPAKETLELLEKHKVRIRRTDKEGSVSYSF